MASSQTNKQAIFPNRSNIIVINTDVSAFSTFQSSIDQVQELHRVEDETGELLERFTAVNQASNGQSNSQMFVVLALFDPDSGLWCAYRCKKILQIAVDYSGGISPASFSWEFNGGLWLRNGARIGWAQSVKTDIYDNWHVTLELCKFNKSVEG